MSEVPLYPQGGVRSELLLCFVIWQQPTHAGTFEMQSVDVYRGTSLIGS